MGFLDKAKDAAKQAQQKLDEAQKSFNEGQAQRQQQTGPAPVEYDKHGRPVSQQAPAAGPPAPAPPGPPAAPHGDPLGGPTAPPPPPAPHDLAGTTPPGGQPAVQAQGEEEVAHGAPSAPPGPPPQGDMSPPRPPGQPDPNQPPKMSSGDPLAG